MALLTRTFLCLRLWLCLCPFLLPALTELVGNLMVWSKISLKLERAKRQREENSGSDSSGFQHRDEVYAFISPPVWFWRTCDSLSS
ncbi:unnamed protein product [Victoria cruziana]